MMEDGHQLVKTKVTASQAMGRLEEIYDEVYTDATAVEELIGSEIDRLPSPFSVSTTETGIGEKPEQKNTI